MANIDDTTLWSDNSEKFDEITRNLEFKRQREDHREPGVFHVRTAWGVPHDEIKELSAQHPDIKFYADHSFEGYHYDTIFTVEYKAGESKVIKAEPSYMFTVMEKLEQQIPCYKTLLDKITEVFKRLDVEVDDPEGGKCIDWANAEVTATIEHDGYKMQATKYHNLIEDIKVFKAHEVKETRWEEITETAESLDVPF